MRESRPCGSERGAPSNGRPYRESRRICRLTAPWVTLSSSAARVKLRSRAAASKDLIAFNGGRRERDML
jgi:hypothetical protein